MAEPKNEKPTQQTAKQAPAEQSPTGQVRCKVVTRYGGKDVGLTIFVDEKEYLRLSTVDSDGIRRFPVLISDADEAELLAMEKAKQEAAMKTQVEQSAYGAGWAEMERQSLATMRARHKAAQKDAEQLSRSE